MPRTPKQLVSVDIPADFRSFMQEVDELIAAEDESTTIETDDLLQCKSTYGGLWDAEDKRFGFRHFRDEGVTWDINLDPREIQAIANGTMQTLSLWRCASDACLCLHPTEDSYCQHCDSIRHFDQDHRERMLRLFPQEPEGNIDALVNLRRIVLAILDYAGENDGRLPPPFTTNADGDRLHSWRSLILPFLDLDDLHQQIDFSQPWDSPANQAIAATAPDVFRAPVAAANQTPYVAVVGPETLWPTNGVRRVSDVTSGLSYTIAVQRAPQTTVGWMEPEDIDFETLASEVAKNDRSLMVAVIDGNSIALHDLDAEGLREYVSI